MDLIAFDSHKRYTWAQVIRETGEVIEGRIEHERGAIRSFLGRFTVGSPVAVETIGNWYWIIDEIEEAGFIPKLVHARKAKVMMGCINKTDKLDAAGLNRLQRNGTLPVVWIAPKAIRDLRELPRLRMVLVRQRTQLKNRIHTMLDKQGLAVTEVTDAFGKKGLQLIRQRIRQLLPQSIFATEIMLKQLESLQENINLIEARMKEVFRETPELSLVMTMPGVGFLLGVVIVTEIGTVERFVAGERLAAYSGTTPRIASSGGKTRFGRLRPDTNRYLKWAFIEAGNAVATHRKRGDPNRHITRLYERLRRHKGHAKAIGAVARHLAEATYWILKKREPYQEPREFRSRHGSVSATAT